jgi:hypothetical protein
MQYSLHLRVEEFEQTEVRVLSPDIITRRAVQVLDINITNNHERVIDALDRNGYGDHAVLLARLVDHRALQQEVDRQNTEDRDGGAMYLSSYHVM